MAINRIKTGGITDGTIQSGDIAPGTIASDRLAGSVANAKLANSSITINGTAVSLGGSVTAGTDWQAVTVADGSTQLTATPNHRKEVTRLSKAAVDGLLANGCNYLHNWCMAENKTSLRWLRHLGFTIEDPEEFGENGELFCHFYRRS